jgi:hypothetical protein
MNRLATGGEAYETIELAMDYGVLGEMIVPIGNNWYLCCRFPVISLSLLERGTATSMYSENGILLCDKLISVPVM